MAKEVKTATATGAFEIVIGAPAVEQLPATIEGATASATPGGLSYASANAEERAEMDKIIASIDLTDEKTIIALGEKERNALAKLADDLLNSMNPTARVQFTEVLGELIEGVRNNNLDAIKKRIGANPAEALMGRLTALFSGKNHKAEATKKMIAEFMTDVSTSRQTIEEMVGRLQVQKGELEKNFGRINELGAGITVAATEMRIVRAAVAEFIRRVKDNKITVLTDLEKEWRRSGNADDRQKSMLAEANFTNLNAVHDDLLGSISVYDMNIATLFYTMQANMQNRIQTRTALTTTVAEWKSQLAMFATVMVENLAAIQLQSVSQLTKRAVDANADLFDTLVASISERAGKGTYDLKALMAAQNRMITTLETARPKIEAQFAEQEKDRQALAVSIDRFRERANAIQQARPITSAAAVPALGAPKPR